MFRDLSIYVVAVFSSDNCASFARWATALTVVTGVWVLVHLVLLNRALPSPLDLGALSAWMVAPYGVNKIAGALTPK